MNPGPVFCIKSILFTESGNDHIPSSHKASESDQGYTEYLRKHVKPKKLHEINHLGKVGHFLKL